MSTTSEFDAQPQAEQTPAMPGALSPAAVRQGLRLSIVEGALSTVHVSITTGAFLTGFALLLGANDFQLGLIGAMPFIGQMFTFVGAYLEARLGKRRELTFWTALGSRVLWGVFALLPFLNNLGSARMPIFLVVFAISQILLGIAGNAWISWMSDLVPARQRGRYFGRRNNVAAISAMVSTWVAGKALDYYIAAGQEALGYAVIFGVSIICAIAGALVLRRQPEPPVTTPRSMGIGEMLTAPMKHRTFRGFALAAAGWAIVTGIASPFFNAYGLQTLHLSYATLALMAIATSAVTLVAQPVVGRLQDRYGDKRVLVVSTFGVVMLPWGWILATPTFLLPLWLTSTFAGVFWPGITQGFTNMLMDRAPAQGRGAYVAAYSATSGGATFAASLLGGVLATALGAATLQLGPLSLDHYVVLFALSSLGRFVMALVFTRWL